MRPDVVSGDPTAKPRPLLEIENLAVSFDTFHGEIRAVRGIDWYVEKGETVAIVGESGCGKTVSIQTVLGVLPPGSAWIKSGTILYDGEDLLKKTPRQMRAFQGDRMSIIFQDPFTYLNPTMAVGEQIAENYRLHRRCSRMEAEAKVLEIMRLIDIPDPKHFARHYPHQLSGGMRQRVMIAMAIVCGPAILFADEPTTALDVTIQAQILDLMNHLKTGLDTAIVLITHDMGVVAAMADRIYIMYAGKIVEHGDVRTIFGKPAHPYTIGLLGSVPRIDSRSGRDLVSIPGSPPDMIAPPAGCAFAARCLRAMNICIRREPPRIDHDAAGHHSACWLNHPARNRGGRESREEFTVGQVRSAGNPTGEHPGGKGCGA